jgi:hypothetical protein
MLGPCRIHAPVILLALPLAAAAQHDPTLDITGLPGYIGLLPRPAPEPWRAPTQRERFETYVENTYSVTPLASALFGAAVSQGINSPREWGQGMEGYGRRVGNNLAGHALRNNLMYGFSVAFREDNRYFRSNKTGAGARIFHALSRAFMARNNQGGERVSMSKFLGIAGTSAISRAWAPRSWQGIDDISINYGFVVATDAGFNVAREFFPDIVRRFRGSGKP